MESRTAFRDLASAEAFKAVADEHERLHMDGQATSRLPGHPPQWELRWKVGTFAYAVTKGDLAGASQVKTAAQDLATSMRLPPLMNRVRQMDAAVQSLIGQPKLDVRKQMAVSLVAGR